MAAAAATVHEHHDAWGALGQGHMPGQAQRTRADEDLLIATGARAWLVGPASRRTGQQVADLVVSCGGEIVVPLADRGEPGGRECTDHVVRVGAQRVDNVRGRDRNGKYHPGGALGPGDLACRLCGGTGGHPVIDDQRRPSGQRSGGLVAAQRTRPTDEDPLFLRLDGGQPLGADLGEAYHLAVDDPYARPQSRSSVATGQGPTVEAGISDRGTDQGSDGVGDDHRERASRHNADDGPAQGCAAEPGADRAGKR
jgi:hypothetical protein